MIAATHWQRESFKFSVACDENADSPLPKKLKTVFHQRYQTERQQIETASNENVLNPWTRAWLLLASQQDSKIVQKSDDVQKRNRYQMETIQNEALDLSMGTLRKRSRNVIVERQMAESLDLHRKANNQSIVELLQTTDEKQQENGFSSKMAVEVTTTPKPSPTKPSRNQADDFHLEFRSQKNKKASPGQQNVSNREHSEQKEDEKNLSTSKKCNQHKKRTHDFGVAQQKVPEYLKCLCCDYKSTSTKDFSRHVRNHRALMAINPYQCEICKKEFKSSDNLRTHAKIHYRTALPYKCNVCGHGFAREATKCVHERQCNRMVYGCVKCKYATNDLNRFLGHFDLKKCHHEKIKQTN